MRAPYTIAGVTFILAVAPAWPQYSRDVIVVGEQHYLRTQQVPHTQQGGYLWEWAVAAHAGRCVYAARYVRFETKLTLMRQFDAWAQPLHLDAIVDGSGGLDCVVGASSSLAWVLWHRSYAYGRIYDRAGEPLGAPFRLPDTAWTLPHPQNLAVREDRTAVLLSVSVDGSYVQDDLYARLFSPEGSPLSAMVRVAGSLEHEWTGGLAFVPGGAMVVAYVSEDRVNKVSHVYLRRVKPDLTLEPPVLVTPDYADRVYLRGLADDTLLVHYHLQMAPGPSIVQRYNGALEPLGPPVPTDWDLMEVSAAGDGRFVLAGQDPAATRVWARLYYESWKPTGTRFEVAAQPEPPKHVFSYLNRRLAYDDDGTIWIAWQAYGNFPPSVWYLTSLKPFRPGDLNYDRVVNNFDIDPFVLALTNPEEYKKKFPGVPYEYIGDCNFDGQLNNFDIDPFVKLLAP